MSRLDNIMLAGCYFFTLAYLATSLRSLQAVKSKLGLIATVLTQVRFLRRVVLCNANPDPDGIFNHV